MSYLFGQFTTTVLGFFGLGPFWVLYIATIIVTAGVILIGIDKQSVLAAAVGISQFLNGKARKTTVRTSIGTFRKIGIVVTILGLILTAAAVDGVQANPGMPITLPGYGSPAFIHCADLSNLACWSTGTSGAGEESLITMVNFPNGTLASFGTQSGTVSCGITPPAESCTTTKSFTPAYPGTSGLVLQVTPRSAPPVVEVPAQTISFVDYNTTWNNIPAAQTELFGLTSDTQWADLQQDNQAQFFYTGTGSTNVAATLTPQYQDPNSGTWIDLAATSGQLDVPYGILGSGTIGIVNNGGTSAPNLVNIAAAVTFSPGQLIPFRVVSTNGGGAGDTQIFSKVYLQLYRAEQAEISLFTSFGLSSFTFLCALPYIPAGTYTCTGNYVAQLLITGGLWFQVTGGSPNEIFNTFGSSASQLNDHSHRVQVDLSSYNRARLLEYFVGASAGLAASVSTWIQFSIDGGNSWNDLCPVGQSPGLTETNTQHNLYLASPYCTIDSTAKTQTILRVVGFRSAGVPVISPTLPYIGVEFSN